MKYKIAEILCVIAAAVFIAFSLSMNAETDKTAELISKEITQEISDFELISRDGRFLKKTLDISPDEIEEFAYFSSDNIMDVSELLVIKLGESSDASEISEKLEKYIDSRYNIFAAYAPEQGELLKNNILKKSGNIILMYVGKDADGVQDTFAEIV